MHSVEHRARAWAHSLLDSLHVPWSISGDQFCFLAEEYGHGVSLVHHFSEYTGFHFKVEKSKPKDGFCNFICVAGLAADTAQKREQRHLASDTKPVKSVDRDGVEFDVHADVALLAGDDSGVQSITLGDGKEMPAEESDVVIRRMKRKPGPKASRSTGLQCEAKCFLRTWDLSAKRVSSHFREAFDHLRAGKPGCARFRSFVMLQLKHSHDKHNVRYTALYV